MRCPKCGYISFDLVDECLKCKKNIKAKVTDLQGSVFQIAPPAFLSLKNEQQVESNEKHDIFGDELGTDDDYVDEDLQILMEDGETELEVVGEAPDDKITESLPTEELELDGSDDGEEGGIEIDLSQFEDTPEPEIALSDDTEPEDTDETEMEALSTPAITIDLPEELSDISDLAPPKEEIIDEDTIQQVAVESDIPDLELEDLNFDLGFEDLDNDETPVPGMAEESMLVLDDLDLSDPQAEESSVNADDSDIVKMDDDLNFDLDLGGLSIHEDV